MGLIVSFLALISLVFSVGAVLADTSHCAGLLTNSQLRVHLTNAATGVGISGPLGPGTSAGGLFGGARMCGALW